jgi:cyclic beta-1,2-glucan synthetase
LTLDQVRFLGTVARKTWAFFETFVGPNDHWLPPDNYQEHPVPWWRIAPRRPTWGSRCSRIWPPTTSAIMPAGELLARTGGALRTMSGLERHRGHCLQLVRHPNAEAPAPLYVSSVDSGNLAGHLLTLQPGLLALIDAPILNPRWLDGVGDTLPGSDGGT